MSGAQSQEPVVGLEILGKGCQSPRLRVNRGLTPAGVLGSGTWGPFLILHEEMSLLNLGPVIPPVLLPGCPGCPAGKGVQPDGQMDRYTVVRLAAPEDSSGFRTVLELILSLSWRGWSVGEGPAVVSPGVLMFVRCRDETRQQQSKGRRRR